MQSQFPNGTERPRGTLSNRGMILRNVPAAGSSNLPPPIPASRSRMIQDPSVDLGGGQNVGPSRNVDSTDFGMPPAAAHPPMGLDGLGDFGMSSGGFGSNVGSGAIASHHVTGGGYQQSNQAAAYQANHTPLVGGYPSAAGGRRGSAGHAFPPTTSMNSMSGPPIGGMGTDMYGQPISGTIGSGGGFMPSSSTGGMGTRTNLSSFAGQKSQKQQHQQQQQQQPQHQQQDSGLGGLAGFGDLVGLMSSATGVNPVVANMGARATSNLVESKVGTIYKWLAAHRLKYYFLVDNYYVLQKIKILLVPFIHKDWQRQKHPQGPQEISGVYQTPCNDVNAPDLYVPTMALITYTLLMGYVLGTFGQFNPEVLTITASSSFGMLFFEFCVLKLGFYLTNSPSPHMLDLVAYCGYKFVGAIAMAFVGIILGPWAFYIVVLLLGCSSAVFMMKTLKWAMLSSREGIINDYPENESSTRSVNNFLLLAGLIQIIASYILVRIVVNPPASSVTVSIPTLQMAAASSIPVDATAALAAAAVNRA